MTRTEAIAKLEAADLLRDHRQSPFDWQVVIYGGACPIRGDALEPQLFQFFKQTRKGGAGRTLAGVRNRADALAELQHRTHFMIRDTDGSVVFDGPARGPLAVKFRNGKWVECRLPARSVRECVV